MLRGKSVSQQDYDDAKAALQQAEATVKSCAAAVETAEINYRRTEVRAPISGRITISNFTVGALLTANQTTGSCHHISDGPDVRRNVPVCGRPLCPQKTA